MYFIFVFCHDIYFFSNWNGFDGDHHRVIVLEISFYVGTRKGTERFYGFSWNSIDFLKWKYCI